MWTNALQPERTAVTFPEKANDHLKMLSAVIAFIANHPQTGKSRISDRVFARTASETESKLLCQIDDLFHCDLPWTEP
jgi:hypothetical protein